VALGVLAAAVVGLTVGSALAFGHSSPPPRSRSATSTPKGVGKSTPTTVTLAPPTTTNTTTTPVTAAAESPTTTTSVQKVDSLIYIDGTNWTLSDVSESLITTCTAGMPSSIQVTMTGGSVTPTGAVTWSVNDGAIQPFQLIAGSVTIPFQCPATVPPGDSVAVAVVYGGDSAHYGCSALARIGVEGR
jgi:hypothetical protein